MGGAVGVAGVSLGLGASILGFLTLVVGLTQHRPQLLRFGKVYAGLVLAGGVLAFVAMQIALITRDFSLSYVAKVGSTKTPPLYNFAALWSSLEGSIILWSVILGGYVVAVVWRFRRRADDPLVGWALATLFAICGFFFLLMFGPANPFTTVAGPVPLDGPGPNALLQNHILMAFHPPVLYLGYVGFSVPFVFAIAALITGRVGEGWLLATRRWTLMAWAFLTVGILLGAWWSYEVLGWGGYWGWDGVENASLLPWLTGTAFLHSVLVQERRGMLRVWNLALLCATFSLTILGTFLTRSGVLDSVHAFTESGIGPWLLTFLAVVVGVSVALIGWRGDRLRSPGTIDSPLSREGAFLANNVVFAVFAFVVLLGTVFPLVVEALRDERIAVGPPFFERMTMPLALALLTLMAVAPVLPWRKASGELLRHRLLWPAWVGVGSLVLAAVLGARGVGSLLAFGLAGFAAGSAMRQLVLATRRQGWRGLVGRANGGMIVHIGVILIAVALAASAGYSKRGEFRVTVGETIQFEGHSFTFLGIRDVEYPEKFSRKADIRIDGGDVYSPSWQRFNNQGQFVGTPSVRTGLTGDLYLNLASSPADGADSITLQVLVNPLVVWLWIGGGVMAVGTLLAAFPGRRRRPTDPVSAPLPGRSGTDEAVEPPVLTGATRRSRAWVGSMVDIDPRPAAAPDPDEGPHASEPAGAARGGRRGRPILVVAIVVAVLAGFLVAVFATSRSGGGDTADTPLLGQPAPAVQGQILGGGSFDLASRRGSWVVLNFFASWCEPCKQEAPELARFAAAQQAEGGGGAEVVGIVYNDTESNIKEFLAQYGGGTFPVVVDGDSGVAIDYGVVKIPETWIIDPDGIVRARVISSVTAEALDTLIREAQGGQP